MNRNMNNTELIQKLETAEKHIAELERDLARTNRLLDDYQLPIVLEDVETDHIIDVTGHKLVELSLRENEARYRSLFENLPVPIWEEDFSAVKAHLDDLKNQGVTDLDAYLTAHQEVIRECIELMQVTDVNQASVNMYGASSKADLLGSLGNTFLNEALAGFKNELLQVAKRELSFHGESFVRTFRGDLHNVIVDWVVSPGYEQTFAKVLVTLSDVTDLRQAQEKYQDIFENSLEGIFQSTPDGRFLSANPALARIYGYDSPQELKESVKDITNQIYFKPEDRNEFTRLMQSKSVIENFTSQDLRKDGTRIWTSTSARAVRDAGENILWYEGFLQDITERKQAEEARNEAELRYRALFEQSHDAIFILDLDGRHLAVNQRAANMLGYTREELLSLSVHELSAEPAQSQQVLKRLLNGERLPIYERLFRSKDGNTIPVEVNVEVVHDANGNPLHIQSVVRDITDRRQAEIELQRRNEDLGLINAINEVIVQGGNLEMVINVLAKEMKRLFSSRGTSLYMLSPDGRWLTMQQYAMSSELTRKIETLIGSTIPIVKIPIQEGGLFQRVLQSGRGIFVSDPNEIQNWLTEFVETEFLPLLARRVIRKLIPQIYKLLNIHSTILVPLISNGKVIGFLDVSSSGLFTLEDLTRIENIGRQLTAAIQRQQANESIQRSEEFLNSIQNALSASIVILDEKGTIVRINSAWRKFGEQNGLTHPQAGLGLNYLDICDSASGPNAEEAPMVGRAIRAVITRQRNEAWVEYPCHSPEGKRWFVLRITKFEDGDKVWVVLAHENITERKQAQDDIQRSVSILAQAGKMAHLGAWEITVSNLENLNENPLHWADEVYRIFGYEPGGVELTVDLFYERVHPDDRQKVQRAISQAIAGRKPYEVEHRIIRPDGVERIVDERADLIFDEQGQVIQILGAVQDITERKRTEQALRETSEQLRTLFEASPEAIMLVDPHGDWPILDCNTTACSMNGYAREELIGQSIDILTLVPGDSAGRAEYFEQVRTAGILRYEDFHRRKDGSIFPIEVSTSLVTLGGQEVILGIDRDITERKRAEEALRESEALYRQAIEVAGAVPYRESYNDDGRSIKYEFIGEGIRQITGYGPEEFNTELWDSLVEEVVLVEDLAGYSLDEGIERVRAGDNPIWKCEHRIRARDGSIHWVFEAAVELRDEHGVSHGSIGMYQDITNRKHSEQALRESEKRYRALFEDMPIAIWEEDFSGAKVHLDSLRQQGVTDFRAYFASHPESLLECAHKVRILDVNNTAVQMYRAQSKEQLLRNLEGSVDESELQQLQAILICIAEGQLSLTWDGPDETFTGERIEINLAGTVSPGHEKDYSRIIFTTMDITERKQAEVELRESEERFRLVTWATMDAVWDWDLQSNQIDWGAGLQKSFHYPPEAIQSAQKWRFDHIHPQDRDKVDRSLRQALEMGMEFWSKEYRFQRADGTYADIMDRGYILHSDTGKPNRIIGAMMDITERKEAEEKLRESERRYHALFEDMPIAIWEEDFSEVKKHLDFLKAQGVTDFRAYFRAHPEALLECAHKISILDVNTIAVQMYHAKDKEKLLRNLEGDVSKIELEQLREVLISISEGKLSLNWEGPDETFTGEQIEINLAASVSPGHEQDLSRIIFTTTDITERRQAEETLRKERARAQNYLDIAGVLMLALDQTGTVTMINQKGCEILGYSYAEIIGKDWIQTFLPEAIRDEINGVFRQLMSGEQEPFGYYENPVLTSNGEERLIAWHNTLVRDSDGRVISSLSSGEDITERKEAEQAVRESEEKYRDLYENNPLMLFTLATDGTVLEVNRAAVLQLEYDEAEMLGQPVVAVFHPEDHARLLKKFQEFIEHPIQTSPWEFRKITKSGKVIWVSETARLIPHKQGELAVLIVCEDITERKEAEHALRESEEKYRLLFESNPLPMWIYDLETLRFLKVNGAAINHYGYSAAEFMSITIKDIRPSKDVPKLLESITQVSNGIDSAGVWEHVRKDGSSIQMDIISHPVQFDGRRAKLVLANDITERIQAEAELRASEERFRQLADNIEEVFWITDAITGEEFYISPAAEKIWGQPIDDLVHGDVFLKMIVPEDRETVQRILADQRSGKKTEMEYRITHPDTSIRWIWDRAFPIFDDAGKVVRLAGIAADITERKRAEQELRESQVRFSNAFEYATIGMALVSPDGHWLRVNQAICKLVGYSSQELLQITFQDITHPDDLELDLSYVRQMLADEIQSYQMEKRYFHKQGNFIWVWLSVSLVRDDEDNPRYFIAQIQDITERKQAEEELRKFSRAVEQSASTIVITDTTGRIEYVNPKFTQTTGYTFEEALGQNPRILKSGFTPPEAYERLWKAITSGAEWHGELLNRKKNSELYWEAVTISPILNERGETTHFIAVKEDITERKKNESEINRHLAELEALYVNGLAVGRLLEPRAIGERMIQTFAQYLSWHHVTIRLCRDNSDELELIAFHLPHMAGGTTEKEEQHFKTHVSRVGQGLSGWVVETGNPFRTSNLADDTHYVNTYEDMQSGLYMPLKMGDRVIGVISVESDEREAFSEQDERLLATLANQAATAFENARLYQASQQEIWDRRIAEGALRQSEENYRRLARELEVRVLERTAEVQDLYDNAPCGYHSLDPDGSIIRVNQTELNWLGYTREEVLGHSLLEFITDESRAAFKEAFPTFKQQGLLRDFELEMLRKDGSIFPVLVSATAIYDKDGRYLTSRSTLFDDTDRKHAMETLRLANSEMKRAMRMKDEFLASMSHELRTPLNAILGLSESLLEQTAGPINEKQHKYLGTVNESGRHLLELINDILDLAKIESGQIKIDPGRVSINTACETSLRMIKQLAQKKNQTVEVEIEKEIGHVWADERRLKQMMVNLLSNAVKFTPAGGQLGLKARVDRKDMKLLVTIWDHGIGIRDEDLKRLFRPFVQLDSSLSRESAGTGLGLALVAEMARLHGGSVSVSSQPGQGSQFTISLPWDPAISTDTLDKLRISSKIPIMKRTTTEKQTILLVEDTESVVLLLRDYLELAGYKVEIARDGADGVSKSIALQPNLILMDVQMPGLDGLEATRRIRKVTSLKNTPIIALTALAMSSDRERCLEAGMDDYLSKPINLKELAKTVLKHLAGSGTGTKS